MVGITYPIVQGRRSKKVLFLNEYSNVFYQNPQSELLKVWMVLRFVDSDIWQLNLYHKQKRDKKFLLCVFTLCFIRIHKVKSSENEWSLDLLTVIFDSWISVTNKKGPKRSYSWKVFICFFKIYQVKSSKYKWSINMLVVIFLRIVNKTLGYDRWERNRFN